jgi:hypothetical protein
MQAQQAHEIAGRALLFGEGEKITTGNVLPGAVARAQRIVGFDAEGALDTTLGTEEVRRLIVANPVDELTDVTDYGSVSDVVTSVADYGSVV